MTEDPLKDEVFKLYDHQWLEQMPVPLETKPLCTFSIHHEVEENDEKVFEKREKNIENESPFGWGNIMCYLLFLP